jgi:NTP pyrophosphatase (non-canonical NTP hydrolase)
MNLQFYQDEAVKYAAYEKEDAVLYPLLALSEEVGEVSGKVAKYIRKNPGAGWELANGIISDSTLRADLKKELGDVLWNLAAFCEGMNISLEEVAKINLGKLWDRKAAGSIVGEGDNR